VPLSKEGSRRNRRYQSHDVEERRLGAAGVAAAVAAALRRDFGPRGHAIKSIAAKTNANLRAVKNWYEGRNAPNGEFLILLCRHSDEVLETVLLLAGRPELVQKKRLMDAKRKVRAILKLMDEIEGTDAGSADPDKSKLIG